MGARIRFLSICLAGLTLAAASPSLAAETLSVSGATNTAVDWQTTTPVTLQADESVVTSKSQVFGLAIENLQTHEIDAMVYDGSAVYAECRYPDGVPLPSCGHSAAVSDHTFVALEPGAYRLRLFGDGSGSGKVSMPLDGADGVALTTDQPAAPAEIHLRDPRLVAPADISHNVIEFEFKQGSLASYLVQQTAKSALVGSGAVQLCFRPIAPTANCAYDGRWGWTGYQGAAAYGDGYVSYQTWGRNFGDYMPAGRWAADHTVAVAGTSDVVELLVVLNPS